MRPIEEIRRDLDTVTENGKIPFYAIGVVDALCEELVEALKTVGIDNSGEADRISSTQKTSN